MATIDVTNPFTGINLDYHLNLQFSKLRTNDTNLNNDKLEKTLSSANIFVGNGSNVATGVSLSGEVSIDNTGASTLSNSAVIGKVLTAFSKGSGTLQATDTILEAIQKLDGNDDLKADLVSSPTLNNILTTDASGQPIDSGKKFNDSGSTVSDIWSGSKIQSSIDSAIAGLDIQADVLNIQTDDTLDPGATPTEGDRYIITDSSNLHANFGTITGIQDDDIVEFDGSDFVVAYDVSVKGEGTLVWDRNGDTFQKFDGTSWSEFGGLSGVTAGSGLSKTENTINANVDNSTIQINGSNNLEVKDAGVTYAKIQNVSANKILGSIAGGTAEEISCTSAGRALLDDADASAQRTTLGLENVDNTSDATKEQTFNTLRRASTGIDLTLTKAQCIGAGVIVKPTADNLTISLPAVVEADDGKVFTVINDGTSSYSFTLDSEDSYTMSGSASIVLAPFVRLKVIYNHSTTNFTITL